MSRRPALFFVLLCVFLDALCIGLIIPVLPRLLGVLTVSREEQAFWYGAVMVGYGLTQFLCAPILGALSDRFGRRPLLLSGILGLGVMSLVPALTTSPAAILISRILGGALSANVVVAQAYIADITPDTPVEKGDLMYLKRCLLYNGYTTLEEFDKDVLKLRAPFPPSSGFFRTRACPISSGSSFSFS